MCASSMPRIGHMLPLQQQQQALLQSHKRPARHTELTTAQKGFFVFAHIIKIVTARAAKCQ